MIAPVLVVFDCDGTLVDSQQMIVAAMGAAFDAHSIDRLPREEVLSIVGLSLFEAVSKLLPDAEPGTVNSIAQAYKDAFFDLRRDPANQEPLYTGAAQTVRHLASQDHVPLGIATGKSQRGVAHLIERHDLNDLFVTIQTADDAPSKPHPGMLEQAMAETGIGPQRAVMIGDTTYDMQMAVAARVGALGVSWGYHQSDHLSAAGAFEVLRDFGELSGAIDRCLDQQLRPTDV